LSAKTQFILPSGIYTRTLCLHLGMLSRIHKRKNRLIDRKIDQCVMLVQDRLKNNVQNLFIREKTLTGNLLFCQ